MKLYILKNNEKLLPTKMTQEKHQFATVQKVRQINGVEFFFFFFFDV